ncbi:sensor domain-containing diguanylate cyclase [Sphingomonas elodea]|uniref:GGDEF domain-containing protein n=1 Tax=Sphingomonas elodea TaxID=179878 RepID=UPI001ED9614C|nr:GGDEF domain-containing protein [Sphingomonas elodea]
MATTSLLRCMAVLLVLFAPVAAGAVPVPLDSRLCLAVTPIATPDAVPDRNHFSCRRPLSAYDQASLWVRIDPHRYDPEGKAVTLLVHHTRFDRLAVAFRYTDGTIEWQQVQSGGFGDHWRPGAQIAFTPNDRSAALESITLRVDRLTSYQLLRLRLVSAGEADIENGLLAALIGAALTLLVAGALYNFSLALGIRRQYLAWQGAWAVAMFLWGAIWSQFGLLVAPGMAGTVAAQSCTALSALAVLLATLSTTTALAGGTVPQPLRLLALLLGFAVAVLGVPATLARTTMIEQIVPILGVSVLANLAVVLLCLIYGIRRGSPEARDLLAAWSVPMAALALTQVVDIGSRFWGGGPQILVLFTSAWQTIWLSIAASRRLSRLRTERDMARAAEARASELAERDPLTAIRNRRGLVEAAQALTHAASEDAAAMGLLLIDIDRFKAINDEHGHDVGDVVLCTIATRLARWEGPRCAVARLGGEEFAMVLTHRSGTALASFADHVRQEIAACDHSAEIGHQRVTVSIGIAEAGGGADFAQLYRDADRALYAAKRDGRDRVCRIDPAAEPVSPSRARSPATEGNRIQRVG